MQGRTNIADFLPLFLNDIPLLDVRAPVEFGKGSFPAAINLPLLNDDERHVIGTTYKLEGQEAAVRLGHKLVSGDIKSHRIAQWCDFAKAHPQGYLFCFRGGMRSHITQEWMRTAGVDYPLVTGGYKALRRYLIDRFEELVANRKFVVIGGRTGIGKTEVISSLQNGIDLENLAHHRGSSFGRRIERQPGQIDFENALAIKLLKTCHASDGTLFIEDESRLVGKCALPPSLVAGLREWPMVILEDTLDNRVSRVQKDYVTDMLEQYITAFPTEGFAQFSQFLQNSLSRIKNKLGGARHQEILAQIQDALAHHERTGDESLHRQWIEALLTGYYDPMYDYHLNQRQMPAVCKGDRDAVLAYCEKVRLSPAS